MKTISQNLKQAFDALAFANAGNLTSLTTMLDTSDCSPESDRTKQRNAAPESASSNLAAGSLC